MLMYDSVHQGSCSYEVLSVSDGLEWDDYQGLTKFNFVAYGTKLNSQYYITNIQEDRSFLDL